MSFENRINTFLNRTPKIKKVIKRLYQLLMYSVSPKIKAEGNIKRISPKDGMEYFFGYYDKSPWDASDRYMLCLRAKQTYKSPAPAESAEIILFDTHDNNSYKVLGKTNSWNVQQGCMLQWLGPDYSERIIYNDFRDGKYCSVILNLKTNDEKILEMPVYSVASDGSFALTLDFSRLHSFRKGYGYSNLPDPTNQEKCPDVPCIWYIDLISGEVKPLLKYTDFANFEPRPEMKDAVHKVNHIMLNPSGNRFMVLHRWFQNSRKYTRLLTADIDGTSLYNLSDEDMVSHCYWKNDREILAYARKNGKNGYYLMEDQSNNFIQMWPDLISDGHPSFSPDGTKVVTDTYPDRTRLSSIYCMNGDTVKRIARVFTPFKYDNEVRCDLHPRWNRKGTEICFDSVFEGQRGLYTVSVK